MEYTTYEFSFSQKQLALIEQFAVEPDRERRKQIEAHLAEFDDAFVEGLIALVLAAQPSSADVTSVQMLDLADIIAGRHRSGYMWALVRMGRAFVAQLSSDAPLASKHCAAALDFSRRHHGEGERLAKYLISVGAAVRERGYYETAVAVQQLAIQFSLDIDAKTWQIAGLMELGINYEELKQFDKALACHRGAIDIAREIQDAHSQMMALGNIGNTYKQIGDLKGAEEVFRHALDLSHELNDVANEFLCLRHLSEVGLRQSEHSVAVEYYRRMIHRAEELDAQGQGDVLIGVTPIVFQLIILSPKMGLEGSPWSDFTPLNVWKAQLWRRLNTIIDALTANGKMAETLGYWDLIEELQPHSAQILISKASALKRAQRVVDALRVCDQAIAIDPSHVEAWNLKATIYMEGKRFHDAIETLERLVQIVPQDAEVWVRMGVCWMQQECWEEMLRCDEAAIRANPNYAQAWVGKGVALAALNNLDEAAACYEKAYHLEPTKENRHLLKAAHHIRNRGPSAFLQRIIRTLLKPVTLLLYGYFEADAKQFMSTGDYSTAIERLQMALKLGQGAEMPILEAVMLTCLGACYYELDSLEMALNCSKRGYEKAQQLGNLQLQEIGIGNMGLAYFRMGRRAEAEQALRTALELSERSGQQTYRSKWLGQASQLYSLDASAELRYVTGSTHSADPLPTLMDQALKLKNAGRLEEAIGLAQEIVAQVESHPNQRRRMQVLEIVGDLYYPHEINRLTQSALYPEYEDRYRQALTHYQRAFEISEVLLDVNAQISLLLKMGGVFTLLGETILSLKKGVALAQQRGDLLLECMFLAALGDAYVNTWQPVPAEQYYRQALRLAPVELGSRAALLTHLGGACLLAGKLAEARNQTQEALKLAQQLKDDELEILCILQLYNIHLTLGEHTLADTYTIRAVRIWEKLGNPGPLVMGGVRNFGEHIEYGVLPTARQAMQVGNYAHALSAFQDAVQFMETARESLPSVKQREAILWDKSSIYWDAIEAAIKAQAYPEAVELLELTKTRNLTDVIAARDPAAGRVPTDILDDYLNALAHEKMQYQTYWERSTLPAEGTMNDVEPYERAWREARQQLVSAIERVRAYEPSFEMPNVGVPIKFAEVLSLSRELDAIIIELVLTETRLDVLLVDSSNALVRHAEILLDKDLLATWLAAENDEVDAITEQLWNKIVGSIIVLIDKNILTCPLVRQLVPIKAERIILIPSRSLHLLPLHAAWHIEAGERRYFSDLYEVSYAPSTSILAQCVARRRAKNYRTNAVIVTNPSLDTPFALEEASLIADLLEGNCQVERVSYNQVQTLTDYMRRGGILHICSHGSEEGLDLIVEDHAATTTSDQSEGTHTRYKPGLLKPNEIEQLDLSQARLVVLSACESGRTRPGGFLGDEYVGLPASFVIAGAPTVVASLWRVSGISTMLLMWKFYALILGNIPISQALQQAQIWLRQANKAELFAVLVELKMMHYTQSRDADEASPDYARLQRAYWALESGLNWLNHQQEHPFSSPYWWAGFQVIGWPSEL